MLDLPIIDAHLHIWDPGTLSYPWLSDVPALDHAFLPADYRAATEGWPVKKMVFVQAEADFGLFKEEVEWVSTQAEVDPPHPGDRGLGPPRERGRGAPRPGGAGRKSPDAGHPAHHPVRGRSGLLPPARFYPGSAVAGLVRHDLRYLHQGRRPVREHARAGSSLPRGKVHARSHRQALHQGRDHGALGRVPPRAGRLTQHLVQDLGARERGGHGILAGPPISGPTWTGCSKASASTGWPSAGTGPWSPWRAPGSAGSRPWPTP